jgi:hypothetical protein
MGLVVTLKHDVRNYDFDMSDDQLKHDDENDFLFHHK